MTTAPNIRARTRDILDDDGAPVAVPLPTAAQIRRFRALAEGLRDLIAEIRADNPHANLYQEEDTLFLLCGPAHIAGPGRERCQQETIVASVSVPGSDGGAW